MSSVVTVTVKHNQKIFSDVRVYVDEPVSLLKAQLWTLSGVSPERQKILIRGLLKDNTDLRTLGLKDGDKIVLIGTTEGREVQEPKEKPTFVEDLSSAEQNLLLKEEKIEAFPLGLANLGNTCFLNSVLQLLRPVEGFIGALRGISTEMPASYSYPSQNQLLNELKVFYNTPPGSMKAYMPTLLVDAFRANFPQLAKSSRTGYLQQDAEQCLSALLNFAKERMGSEFIHSLFKITAEYRLKCIENESEEAEVGKEQFLLLPCHLGSVETPIYNMYEGIKLSMEEAIEKHSPSLGKNAIYKKQLRLTQLPEYLLVHFVRFEWKKAQGMPGSSGGRAKICRKILFSSYFDVYDFCCEPLQKSLMVGRKIEALRKSREYEAPKVEAAAIVASPMEKTTEASAAIPFDVESEKRSNKSVFQGKYELASVVTHKGRYADSGHYVGWIKKDEDQWFEVNDSDVTLHKWANTDLCGGRSDYHIAYICLYKRCTFEVTEEEWMEVGGGHTED